MSGDRSSEATDPILVERERCARIAHQRGEDVRAGRSESELTEVERAEVSAAKWCAVRILDGLQVKDREITQNEPHVGWSIDEGLHGTRKVQIIVDGVVRHQCEHVPTGYAVIICVHPNDRRLSLNANGEELVGWCKDCGALDLDGRWRAAGEP